MQINRLVSVRSQYRLVAGLLVAVAALSMPGCNKGTDRVTVEGAVRVAGEPLEKGAINFVPVKSTVGRSAGAEIAAGRYLIAGPKGPVPGKYRVEIVGTRKTGKQVPDMLSPGRTVEGIEQFIPDKYNVKSQLEVELRPGDNKGVDFDLKM